MILKQVAALRQIEKQELVDFFNEYIKVGAAQKRTLSIGVYGNRHGSEYTADKSESQRYSMKIDDIFSFRRSQALYGSFRGVAGHVKL
jgi:insulysin